MSDEHDDPMMFCSREIGRAARTVAGGATVAAQRKTSEQTAQARQATERAQTETRALHALQETRAKRSEATR